MRRLYRISAYLLFLGVIHTALTLVFYDKFAEYMRLILF
jgi:hypothetical protein